MNSQASLLDQLAAVMRLANKAGMYDAADFIQRILEPEPPKVMFASEYFEQGQAEPT